MFRISNYMNLLNGALKSGSLPFPEKSRKPSGPVVIWNLIRRCNLACKHCYTNSGDVDYPLELSTQEVFTVMDDLYDFGVRVLILSGGEPLLRPDIFEISRRAKAMGFYVGLSTNGTKITDNNISDIVEIGYNYVGISLDGLGETHDGFRRKKGAFVEALNGIHLCQENGIKVGVRYCLTQDTQEYLPKMLKFVEDEQINKFYMSHLNYSGRGYSFRKIDTLHKTSRAALDRIFDFTWKGICDGKATEVVTGNNDADGVYFLMWVKKNFPEFEEPMKAHLVQWGGNSTGVNIANIDNLGHVHPDSFWWNFDLGNIRKRPFSEIWSDLSNPMIAAMRTTPKPIKGSCSHCQHFKICNGNTRVRAYQLTGDFLQEDPGCYLSNREIGLSDSSPRLIETLDIKDSKRERENVVHAH